MNGRAAALRSVLGHGIPVVIEVSGRSMEPTLELGVKVNVAALEAGDEVRVGDLVLMATDQDAVLLLHRVMHVFTEGSRPFVMHQGDAHPSTFGICPREDLLARVIGFAAEPARPLPTLERLPAAARARFRRRRLACEGFALSRRLSFTLGLRKIPLVRACGQVYRRTVTKLIG